MVEWVAVVSDIDAVPARRESDNDKVRPEVSLAALLIL